MASTTAPLLPTGAAAVALGSATTGIQEITRRLQDERDALRNSVEDLTRQLSQERAARGSLEHELQVKELEILHEQQRTRQAKQTLQEKVMQLEKELDDEKAMQQMAIMGRNVAADKNQSLAADVREMEAKFKKELAKKETLSAELDQAREEIQMLLMERDAIIQRTEADAKRVRELWAQINQEHETQTDVFRGELEAVQEAKDESEETIAELQSKVEQLEASLRTAVNEKTALEAKIAQSSNEKDLMKSHLERERDRERDAGQHKSQLELQLQDMKSRCMLLEERERIAVKEKDLAETTAKKAEAELEARTEELLVLKIEFSDLLDKHERYAEEFKQRTRQHDVEAKLRLKKLEQSRKCAEEMAMLRKREVTEYKQVMRSVNRRLNQAREKQQELQSNQVNEIRTAPKSLSIYRH